MQDRTSGLSLTVALLFLGTGCDYREGLRCGNTNDCFGLLCQNGLCSAPAASSGFGGGAGGGATGAGGGTAKTPICGTCVANGDCDQNSRPSGTTVSCFKLGDDPDYRCRIILGASLFGVCDAFAQTASGNPCLCPFEIADRGQRCGTGATRSCKNGASPTLKDVCVSAMSGGTATCLQACTSSDECPGLFSCRALAGGGGACSP